MKKIGLVFSFLLITVVSAFAQNGIVKNVSSEEFKKLMNENKKAEIIDLRTNDEIKAKGKIKGAKQIDFLAVDAEKKIAALDKNKTYLVYCAGGGRSGDAAELMHKQGFKEVVNLEKGFGEWLKKGFEIEK